MNSFSVRRSCKKTGHQRKGSIPEPYGVCCWCVLQMGVWRTWWPVGWGKYMAADYSSRQQWSQTITLSMEQFLVKLPGSSQLLQWGGVWDSSGWRMAQTFPAGSFQKSLHCNGNASKYHLLSEGLTSAVPQFSFSSSLMVNLMISA